jgi:hypothetical protein
MIEDTLESEVDDGRLGDNNVLPDVSWSDPPDVLHSSHHLVVR